jgi:hypothetical protein
MRILSLASSKSAVLAYREEGGFVHQIGEIGAGGPGRRARDALDVDVAVHGDLRHVDGEDVLALPDVGHGDDDLPVEAARP